MSELEARSVAVAPPELTGLDAPNFGAAPPSLSGPPLSPAQYIYFYDPDEWEKFIREWATGLSNSYVQIKLMGGPNDRGVDVAAFKTKRGFEGAWDCYQGKHYAEPLKWSQAFPEMLKVLRSVLERHYILPDRYAFLAPRGCGMHLNRLLSKPTALRDQFMTQLAKGSGPASHLDPELIKQVRALAEETDFALFQSVELPDALETHRATRYHVARFGAPVPPRPEHRLPPGEIAVHEARYLAQLIEVYTEKAPAETFVAETLSSHRRFGPHFQRQRESFYSAEALRMYARDSVPPGTFESLKADVFSGVIEIAETSHPSGMDRLTSVLTTSGQLDLSRHALVSVSTIRDRQGICHQLANEDRLTWVKEES